MLAIFCVCFFSFVLLGIFWSMYCFCLFLFFLSACCLRLFFFFFLNDPPPPEFSPLPLPDALPTSFSPTRTKEMKPPTAKAVAEPGGAVTPCLVRRRLPPVDRRAFGNCRSVSGIADAGYPPRK